MTFFSKSRLCLSLLSASVFNAKTTLFLTFIVEDGHPTVSEFTIYYSSSYRDTQQCLWIPIQTSQGTEWLAQQEAAAYLIWLVVGKMTPSHSTTIALNPWGLGRQLSKIEVIVKWQNTLKCIYIIQYYSWGWLPSRLAYTSYFPETCVHAKWFPI